MDSDRIVVAEILRPRGIRGELVAVSQTDVPGRLETLKIAQVRLADGSDMPVEIVEAWRHKGDWVLKFAGIDSIDEADRFRGADLWVLPQDRGTLSDGEFFRSDLIGCQVVNTASGDVVGIVKGWQQYGSAAPLMEVNRSSGEALIPFVAALCKVDLVHRTIQMDLPAGLLEL